MATGKSTWTHTYLLYNVEHLKVGMASLTRQHVKAHLQLSKMWCTSEPHSRKKKVVAETILAFYPLMLCIFLVYIGKLLLTYKMSSLSIIYYTFDFEN